MRSFEENRRQLRIAAIAISIILPSGVLGFMVIEHHSLLNALWLTITTLTTIGYGDVVATSTAGRVFTLLLIVFGISAYALAANAAVQFISSPIMRETRMRRRAEHKIRALKNHYIICGSGELVDKTISYLLKRAELRRKDQRDAATKPVNRLLERVLGAHSTGIRARVRAVLRAILVFIVLLRHQSNTLLDVIVVLTNDAGYAERLRDTGLLVLQDDPTDDHALRTAGLMQAQAMMVMLESDTETLLTVLTARSRSKDIYITATSHDDLQLKINRVGANNVLMPFELAGEFLNNATLRPAVSAFFNSILFDQSAREQVVQLFLWDDSPWVGKTLSELDFLEKYHTGIIGLRTAGGTYIYVPEDAHTLQPGEVLLAVTPGQHIPALLQDCYRGRDMAQHAIRLEPLYTRMRFQTSDKRYSLYEAEGAIKDLSHHYIICGEGPTIRHALGHLNPARPFVVISASNTLTSEMMNRGFRVVHGDPTQDETLYRAGIERALAIMVSIEDNADQILTILNARAISETLLITATAHSDDMVPKLRRAGADRVISPFRIAAQFVLLATTRPAVSDFMQYVLFNYEAGIETTELYMQDNSPWIGQTIDQLNLRQRFNAGVIGVRLESGRFVYAPRGTHKIAENEVLLVTTPMTQSDELRQLAHGGVSKRPKTLRPQETRQSGVWKLTP